MAMNNINEAYGPILTEHWEKEDNPQHYDFLTTQIVNPNPQRHILGIVGGNEVSLIKGNMVDLESDLFGITRPFTWSTERKHLPNDNSDIINRSNPKNKLHIDAIPVVREEYQLWSYPEVNAPLPFKKEACSMPHKF